MPGSFIDTNVLIYLASDDVAKAERAENILGNGGTISVQVLNEVANVARRKMRLPCTDVHAFLDLIRGLLRVVPITVETHEAGLALAERYLLSTYDAMIAAAALQTGCTTLWSEDMRHGVVLENQLRILNPFREPD